MIRIFALTQAGAGLGNHIKELLLAQGSNEEVSFELKPVPFAETVQTAFTNQERLILICATGIAVRTLAPVLVDKYTDPAVLVLDEGRGVHCINRERRSIIAAEGTGGLCCRHNGST